MIDFNRLAGPFEPSKISWRIGSVSEKDGKSRGMALAYIDARDVMERLDDVVGPGGWQNDYPHAGSKTVCRIGILINDAWVWKSDGAGDTDVEAEKGSLSDAFKRAAVRWGIGRYLYDIASPWVELEGTGKFKKIAQHEYARLERLLKNSQPSAPIKTPDPLAEAAARYITDCERAIDAETNRATLIEWWNGDQRKDDFRKFQLTPGEGRALTDRVRARAEALTSNAGVAA